MAVVNSPVTGTPSAISNTTALALSSEVVMAVTDAPQTAPPAGGSSPTGVAAIPTLVSTSPMSAPVLEGSRPVQIQPEGPVASDDPHSTTPSASPRSPFSTPNWPTTPAASPDANAATDVAFLPVGTPPSTSSTIGAQTPQTGPSNLKNAPLPKGAPRLVSTPGLAVQGKDYPVTTLPGTLSPAMSSDGSLSDDSLLAPMTPSTESEAGTPAFSTPAKKDSKLAHEPLPTVDQTILAAAMPMVVTPPVIPLVVTVPGEKETASANSASTGTQTPVLQSPLPASQFFSGAKTELSSKASPQPGAAAPYSLSSFGKPSPSPQSTGSPIAGRLDSQKTGAKSSVAPEIARQPSNSATAPVPPVAAEIHVSPDAMAINQATVVPQSELQQTAVTMAESKDSSIETRP
ncbi:MAG TPA: hypothetical protein VHH73_10225, partial [Verrucomicrobiae bacterium]|nr:hypothetical protein [Verrucomicrobiae bacterium]